MFAPSAELSKALRRNDRNRNGCASPRATQELIRDYVLKNFTGNVNGQRPRMLFSSFAALTPWKRFIARLVTSCMSAPAGRRFAIRTAITSPIPRQRDLL